MCTDRIPQIPPLMAATKFLCYVIDHDRPLKKDIKPNYIVALSDILNFHSL